MQAKKPFSVIGKTLLAALLAGGGLQCNCTQ